MRLSLRILLLPLSLSLVWAGCTTPTGVARPIPAHSRPPSQSIPDVQRTRVTSERVVALALTPPRVPAPVRPSNWLAGLVHDGINALVLPIGESHADAASQGEGRVYFQTGWAPLRRDVFGEWVARARAQGLLVYASVSLRNMPWIDPALGWDDRRYDPSTRKLRSSESPDLLHPAFQEYLLGLLADVSFTGIDGILFRDAAL